MPRHVSQLLHDKKIIPLAWKQNKFRCPSSLLTRATAKIVYVGASSAFTPLHSVCVCVCQRLYMQSSSATRKRESEESNGRERQIAHTQITHAITHTHTHAAAEWVYPTAKSKRK
ncbi:hypothetical protein TCDM_11126 [Trypanosoma cruzi Dm28c]|uniref:Uncharacterized protein n=1 Tax=Trypanosoma cruzi Dm28c TaxID=1416333 RepID=V5AKU3_TRYCR|nr:hypothetical protein TCDM_11126 [Trypanosoma cruzi Dm28c]